jgi:hypothetical protein
MQFNIVKLSSDPPQPKAGQSFRLTAELDQKAAADLSITLEKQRIVESAGGAPELRPTGPKYFDLDPKPIKVLAGSNRGTSEPIQVKKNPSAQQRERPIVFPEQLLFNGVY